MKFARHRQQLAFATTVRFLARRSVRPIGTGGGCSLPPFLPRRVLTAPKPAACTAVRRLAWNRPSMTAAQRSDAPASALYPPVDAYSSGMLKVSELHEIYYEEAGNPEGIPILFVHGGPGGGIEPKCRRFFDPAAYRIILFAQRGCGKSIPLGSVEENTTWHLVSDMEKLRETCGVDSWVLFGGSWGSTLSLAYAQSHPDRVRALVLRGIFTVRQAEVDWFYERGGAGMLYPAAFEKFVNGLPESKRDAPSLVAAYDEVFHGSDLDAARKAAIAWSSWEGSTSFFNASPGPLKYEDPDFAMVFARVECHYFTNKGFFERDGYLLQKENIDKIRSIPTSIVQGRWDAVCPLRTAHDLKTVFPEAELHVIESAGHSAFEAGSMKKLVELTDRLRGS